MFETLARNYLERRGWFVMPLGWCGFAVSGNVSVIKTNAATSGDLWQMGNYVLYKSRERQ